jgi:hypothetical protein
MQENMDVLKIKKEKKQLFFYKMSFITQTLSNEKAIEIWSSEYYVLINKYLAGDDYCLTRNQKTTLEYDGVVYSIPYIISVLISNCVRFGTYFLKNNSYLTKQKEFYRGESKSLIPDYSYNRKTFTSVTYDFEKSLSFAEDNFIFKVTIDNEIGIFITGIESEIVIEPNVYWEFIGMSNEIFDGVEYKIFNIHVSEYKKNSPSYGDLIENLKNKENIQITEDLIEKPEFKITEDNFEDFNLLEDENFSINDFEDELNVYNIDYDKTKINELFEQYLSFKTDV